MGIKVRKNDQWVTVATASLGTGTTKLAQLWDEKTSGTNGGTFTLGDWRDRTLNEELDPQGFVTLESDNVSFSLLSGTYRIAWSAPAYNVDMHKTQLVYSTNSDFSAPVTTIQGSSEFDAENISTNSQTRSFGDTQLTITEKTYFKIQHRSHDTQADWGLGSAANFPDAPEIYTQVSIEDLNTAAGAGGGGGDITDGDKGDITVTNSGATWTIDNDTIEEKHINAGGTAANGKILKYDSTHATDWSWADPGATVTTSDSAPVSPSDGDLWWNSTTGILNVYYEDANSSQWVNATGRAGGAIVQAKTKVATVKDVKAYNVDGGTFNADTWVHRTLNTLSDPNNIGLSISGNIVTVPAGTYTIRWRAPAYLCNRFTSRLAYSSTSSTVASGITYVDGTTGYSHFSDAKSVEESFGEIASITFSTTTYLKIEQYSDQGYTAAASGLGVGSYINGVDSVFTTLVIEDLATAIKEDGGVNSSFTQNGTGAVTRTVDGKLKDNINVWDFIPVGTTTASTDCASYFQAAINTGKTVYVPKGTYRIDSTLLLDSGYETLIGDECMPILLKWTEGPAIQISEPGGSGLNEYSRVENFYIQRKIGGSYTCPTYNETLTESLAGVVVSGHGASVAAAVQSTRISNLRVGNFAVGFYFADCVGVTVHKCFTQNLGNYTSAISYTNANGATVSITSSMWGVGFYFDATRYGGDATTDVSEDLIIFNSHGFTTGTAVILSGLSNTTGISNNVTYYVSETSNTTNSFRLTTASDGAASGNITLGGSDDTSGVYVEQKAMSPLASIEIVECDDNRQNDPATIKSVSYLIVGRDPRDIFFQRAESSHADYGYYIDGKSNDDLNWDVHIIRPIIDTFKKHGIFVNNLDGVGSLSIIGGYYVGVENAEASIYGVNSNGICITGGAQVLGLTNHDGAGNTDDGIRLDSCSSCSIIGNRFANLQYAISLNGTTYSTIQGNVISAAVTGEDAQDPQLVEAIRLFGNSTYNTVGNNTIRGLSGSNKYTKGIYLESGSDNCKLIGNIIESTTVATQIDDSASGTEISTASVSAPASATSTGVAGTIAYDSSYVYICIATNTWKRVAISSW